MIVVITGGGQGLGRAYALAFAARKAKVVINDLGTIVDPKSQTPLRIADLVAEEVIKLGGQALANYDSVENAEKIIQDTVKHFGRVDVIINNAGILRDKAFHNMKAAEYKQVLKVHLKGTFLMCRCAWPYMRQQGFGRIINTSSVAGIFGNFGQANYSAAKLAIVGLTNTLSREGESKNVLVNCIAPVAATGMTKGVMASDLYNSLTVDHIVPLVEYLASPDCTLTGNLLEVGGGWVAKLRWQRTKGVSFDFPLRAEDVRDRFDEIGNFENEPEYPDSGNSSVVKMFENFERNQKRLQANFSPPLIDTVGSYKLGKDRANKTSSVVDYSKLPEPMQKL